jgi:hypothetical protein
MRKLALMVATAALLAGTALARDNPAAKRDPTINSTMVAAGFLDSHPDLLYRSRGLDRYGEREYDEAFQQFRRAAYYSDKPSQAIVGEMLWIGLGAPKDRALAYVWMDLAAERGYLSFVEKRKLYWDQLDESERIRAEREGAAIRADYGDAVAEQRLHYMLRRERSKMTGSRLASLANPVQISVPGVGTLDSSQYYHPKYWEPKEYRAWQDSIWQELRIGKVSVGDVQQLSDADAPGEPVSRPANGQPTEPAAPAKED